jgi:hypothetical protein
MGYFFKEIIMCTKLSMLLAALGLVFVSLTSGCSRKEAVTADKTASVKKEQVYAAPIELGDINVHLYAGKIIAQNKEGLYEC